MIVPGTHRIPVTSRVSGIIYACHEARLLRQHAAARQTMRYGQPGWKQYPLRKEIRRRVQ